MKRLLLPRQAEVLSLLARGRSLLAFDFDGTLAPLVRDREKAALRASTRALLARVSRLYPTAVISGRGRGDVTARLVGAGVKYVVGVHGIEVGGGAARSRHALDEARARLGVLVEATPGLELEDKRYSVAVHYRRVRGPRAVPSAVFRVLASLSTPVRVVPGKWVLDVLPAGSPHKGDALLALRARERADLTLYVGDDVTDEDVFRLEQPGHLVSVRVGRMAQSAATHFLRDQAEIDGLLRRLASLRE